MHAFPQKNVKLNNVFNKNKKNLERNFVLLYVVGLHCVLMKSNTFVQNSSLTTKYNIV